MELTWKVFLSILLPLHCLGGDGGLTEKFISLAGPLTDELVSNLCFESGRVREPTFHPGTAPTLYHCSWPSLSSLPPYFAQLYASGVTHFKVFLPWTHILPVGDVQNPNETNVECYKQLLRTLRASNLKSALILHQKTLPKTLDQSRAFSDLFVDYADFVFASFGDLVDMWLTFSNVLEVAEELPHEDLFSPPLHVLALAHRAAYKIYHEKYSSEGGKVSIALDVSTAGRVLPGSFLASILVMRVIFLTKWRLLINRDNNRTYGLKIRTIQDVSSSL